MLAAVHKKLTHYKEKFLIRKRLVINDRFENYVMLDKQLLLNFSSNDYLGLSNHPDVKKAFIQGVNQFGSGSGAAALVTGFYQPHQLLEEKMAEFLGRERALLFNSGYAANLGVFTAFANRHHTIYADKFCHASILDGVRLSRAQLLRFHHNSLLHLEDLLTRQCLNSFLVTESVFGMEGNITPLASLVALSKKYQTPLIVDDAHAIGILGEYGRGISEYFGLAKSDIACLITPLGKAFGSMGAIVSGANDLIESLLQFSRTYCYSTALPPAVAVATLAALKIMQTELWRRKKLIDLIHFFNVAARKYGLTLIADDITPIKCILINDNQLASAIQKKLMQQGFLVSCIRPPTVPINTARIRISLNCLHKENDIMQLLNLLADYAGAQC